MVKDDSQYVTGKGKKKNSKRTQKKMRFHRPRIMEEGKKPRNPATTRLRTISKKRKKKDNDKEDEVIAEPRTPEKQSFPKRRKVAKTKRNVARTLNFDLSCLEVNRIFGPNFPKGRKRTTTVRRSDFHCLISPLSFPMPIWKKQSRRSNRKKNVVRWVRIALGLLSQVDVSLPIKGNQFFLFMLIMTLVILYLIYLPFVYYSKDEFYIQ